METIKTEGMNCNIETGLCEMPEVPVNRAVGQHKKPVKLLYFTDPICSSCWGIEPQLRKLKQEYGAYFDVEYRMGGLLKNWEEYGGTDVNGPASVARHWEEAGAFYEMPIDGAIWNEDPLFSSYPAGIAFKAAQLQGSEKAEKFLRRMKEMVFVERKNITRSEYQLEAAKDAGLDDSRFAFDYDGSGPQLFQEDLDLARAWGVRGFPTIYFIDEDDNRFKVYGSKPYHVYEQALLKLIPGLAVKKSPFDYDTILESYETTSAKEFAVFYDKSLEEAETILGDLEKQNKITRMDTPAGRFWKLRK